MKVKTYVYVIKDGATVLLRPGDTVPAGVTVTNPDVIEADAVILPAPAAEETASEPKTPETPAEDEPETPAVPEPAAPATRKRTSRTKATASE